MYLFTIIYINIMYRYTVLVLEWQKQIKLAALQHDSKTLVLFYIAISLKKCFVLFCVLVFWVVSFGAALLCPSFPEPSNFCHLVWNLSVTFTRLLRKHCWAIFWNPFWVSLHDSGSRAVVWATSTSLASLVVLFGISQRCHDRVQLTSSLHSHKFSMFNSVD